MPEVADHLSVYLNAGLSTYEGQECVFDYADIPKLITKLTIGKNVDYFFS